MKKTSLIPAVTEPTEAEFNGHPVLTFPNPDDVKSPGIQLGVKKLRAILAYVNEAKEFVAKHHKPKASGFSSAAVKKLKDLGLGDAEIAEILAETESVPV